MAEVEVNDENQQLKSSAIVVPNPKPNKGFSSKVVDLIEKLIVKWMYDSSQPHHDLAGNFAPVADETPPTTNLPVIGHLPECLNGEFVRVGPNPKFAPVAGYHWFDGDGMVHGMRVKDGKATLVSRYVRTSHLKQEEYFGGSKFMKVYHCNLVYACAIHGSWEIPFLRSSMCHFQIGDLKGFLGLFMMNLQMLRAKLKILDMSYGFGTGNTALIYQHGKLLALQ